MNGNRIGYWVKARGFKNNHLAKEIGVSVQTFSRWVNNVTQPNLLQSAWLAKKLNVQMEDLIENKEGE